MFGPTTPDDLNDVNDILDDNTAWTDPQSTHTPPTSPAYGNYYPEERGHYENMPYPTTEYGQLPRDEYPR